MEGTTTASPGRAIKAAMAVKELTSQSQMMQRTLNFSTLGSCNMQLTEYAHNCVYYSTTLGH